MRVSVGIQVTASKFAKMQNFEGVNKKYIVLIGKDVWFS